MAVITLHDKTFKPYLASATIQQAVKKVAAQINADYADRNPIFIAVLNGSFMFAADLMKEMQMPCEISFVKMKSYEGTQSSGALKQLIGLDADIENRDVVLIEDIVDTGNTMVQLFDILRAKKVASVEIVTLLHKPAAMLHNFEPKYVGIAIPNDFVVGYGLDYDELGRNYKDIYVVVS